MQRELTLEVGILGVLLHRGEIAEVKPLEGGTELAAARPAGKDGKLVMDANKIEARRRAIVSNTSELSVQARIGSLLFAIVFLLFGTILFLDLLAGLLL